MNLLQVSNLELWEAALWVAKKESFTEAAKALRLTTGQVSKRIHQLETALNTRLFKRTTRKVSLSLEAQSLIPSIEALIDTAHGLEARASSKEDVAGLIRIACLPSFVPRCLGPSLIRFRKKFPGVEFEIDASEAIVDLVERNIDIAIRVQKPSGAEFVFRKLMDNRIILCASPKYLKARGGAPKNLKDLESFALVTLDLFENLKFLKEGKTIGSLKCPKPIRCESGSIATELALAEAGIAVRSAWDVKSLIKSGQLVEVLPNSPLEVFGHFYAVTPHRRFISNRVRHFIEFILKEAGDHWAA